MKQSFFSELSVALQGRSRVFRMIVITSLIFCLLIFLEFAVHVFESAAASKNNGASPVQNSSRQLPAESLSLKEK